MMVDLKVMAYFKISLSTRNWDRAQIKGGSGEPVWITMTGVNSLVIWIGVN